MAERERLTNKERRTQAREERKRREAEAAAKRRRSNLRNTLIGAIVVVVVGAVLAQAFLGGPTTLDDAILVSSTDVEDARAAAGCEVLVDREPLEDRTHYEATAAPSADSLYRDVRPTHSGPHTVQFHPIVSAGSRTQLDERSTTHNLEHGTVIAWYDPDLTDAGSDMGRWSETLNANGFAYSNTGAAILVSPYTDPGISSGKAIAFRAWGVAMDCDEWDETVANGFVIDNYGTHGIAPERTLGPYPTAVLAYDDIEVGDNTDAPLDGDPVEGEPGGEDVETTDDDPTESDEQPGDEDADDAEE